MVTVRAKVAISHWRWAEDNHKSTSLKNRKILSIEAQGQDQRFNIWVAHGQGIGDVGAPKEEPSLAHLSQSAVELIIS